MFLKFPADGLFFARYEFGVDSVLVYQLFVFAMLYYSAPDLIHIHFYDHSFPLRRKAPKGMKQMPIAQLA